VLIVAWLLAALRAGGPYPLLAISGEQGSAKTVLSKLLKALIDPNAAPVRSLSREERELMIAANNGITSMYATLWAFKVRFPDPVS
jgi:ABC-type phosphonate transport system ATPase subunit